MAAFIQIGPFIKKLQANKVCNPGNSRFATCISISLYKWILKLVQW